jgi:photoactive yellow protein
MPPNLCPWCGDRAEQEQKICSSCYQNALVIPNLKAPQLDDLPFGIIELDSDGRILAFNRAEEERSCLTSEDVIGKNFFTDIAPCTQVKEYEGRFKEFLSGDQPAIEFSFTYTFPHGRVSIHVLMLRAHGRAILIVSKERVA